MDSEGRPAAGAPLSLELAGARDLGPCADARDERAGETGDFRLCRHVHAFSSALEARVRLGNHTARAGVDPLLRRAFVPIVLDEPWPTRSIQGERAFARTFVVTGRLVQETPAPVTVEAVGVNATPRGGGAVNASLLSAEGVTLARGAATTDFFGDYRVELEVTDVPTGARVLVEAPRTVREEPADAALRRADVAIAYPRPVAPPGTALAPAAWVPLILVALAAAAALLRPAGRRGRR